jgi:hypothetical protein
LLDQHFIIRTDNYALTFLDTCRPSNGRLMRFSLYLQQFDFTTEHVKGSENLLADFLSRFPLPTTKVETNTSYTVQSYKINVIKSVFDQILEVGKEQDTDVSIRILKDSITKGSKAPHTYVIKDNVLYRLTNNFYVIVLPTKMLNAVFEYFHDNHGHFGIKRTLSLIKSIFYHTKLRSYLKKNAKNRNLIIRL